MLRTPVHTELGDLSAQRGKNGALLSFPGRRVCHGGAACADRGDPPYGKGMMMTSDANAIFRAENGALERLSALETLKGLKNRDAVTPRRPGPLPRVSRSVGPVRQDHPRRPARRLRRPRPSRPAPTTRRRSPPRRSKQRILEDELADIEVSRPPSEAPPEDGGLSTDEVARQVLPFVEGNGDVTRRGHRRVHPHRPQGAAPPPGGAGQAGPPRAHRRRPPRGLLDALIIIRAAAAGALILGAQRGDARCHAAVASLP
jgi:hypothetical protein